MSVKFEFYLSDHDANRLFALKEDNKKDKLTGNEYARELLEDVLFKMHPAKVRYNDETGERIKS